jgi:hypothetical protein
MSAFARVPVLFVVLLLAPDVGMLGYVRGNRVGATLYDLFHTYLPPGVLAVVRRT